MAGMWRRCAVFCFQKIISIVSNISPRWSAPRPKDPDQPLRQKAFLRALRTIPNLEIILGTFLSHEVTMPRSPIGSGFVKVIKTEEKGSDVNLATHLLLDGFRNDYELAIVVSNDSDLLLPIRVVTEQFGKPVGLLNPQRDPSVALIPHVLFVKNIRQNVLKNSQFPPGLNRQAWKVFQTRGLVT